jgi:hypothetical protein
MPRPVATGETDARNRSHGHIRLGDDPGSHQATKFRDSGHPHPRIRDIYGSLGPGENVAALFVWCSNTGGTADGQIENSLVIYSWVSGRLTVLSTLTPQHQSKDGTHVAYFDGSTVQNSSDVLSGEWFERRHPRSLRGSEIAALIQDEAGLDR